MNFGDTLKGLMRRKSILVVGLILAVVTGLGVWTVAHPTYERSATLLLLPGKGSLPSDSQNPFLFLGGLTFASDIVVRATGSGNVQHQISLEHPGTSFEVVRDPTTAGPVIRITVTAGSSDESAVVLDILTTEAATALHDLQVAENIGKSEQITTVIVTKDDNATVGNRLRIALSALAGLFVLGTSVIIAAATEGTSARRHRWSATGGGAERGNPAMAPGNTHRESPPVGTSSDEEPPQQDRRDPAPIQGNDEMTIPMARRNM